MSWTALMLREFHEHVRPGRRFAGHFVMAAVMSMAFGAGGAVGAGFLARGAAPLFFPGASLHWHAASALLAGLIAGGFAAIFLPMNLGVEAVEGERERHTLATLAAVPLTDAQIIHAKSLAILLACALVAALGGVAVAVTLVVLYAGVGLVWALLAVPAAVVAVAVPTYSMTGWAIAMSTRAKTVKDAGQRMVFVMMPLMLAYPVVSMATIGDPGRTLVIVPIVLGAVGLLLLLGPVLAFARFRRERLLTV